MSDQEIHEGGCLCGALRYRVTGPIPPGVHCHCSICRRSSGGTVMTWTEVPLARFEVTRGELAVYQSSEQAERRFCPKCGTQIVFAERRRPNELDIAVATLDRPEDHPPQHHIWVSSALPWLCLDEHLPAHEEFTPQDAPDQKPPSPSRP